MLEPRHRLSNLCTRYIPPANEWYSVAPVSCTAQPHCWAKSVTVPTELPKRVLLVSGRLSYRTHAPTATFGSVIVMVGRRAAHRPPIGALSVAMLNKSIYCYSLLSRVSGHIQ